MKPILLGAERLGCKGELQYSLARSLGELCVTWLLAVAILRIGRCKVEPTGHD